MRLNVLYFTKLPKFLKAKLFCDSAHNNGVVKVIINDLKDVFTIEFAIGIYNLPSNQSI